ncbi:Ku protein [Bradyrhizobium sp. 2TAF36]|uniref:Ku protein n=1 Tax=Bradyrhizobium sp. 2TAF36 TaxID=3233016 RepID=UPI003F8F5DAF
MAPRANWKGFLRLSLVTCPVALYPATSESEKISFNQLNRATGHRIKYLKVDADTGDEVPNEDIVKGYKVDTDTFIEVTKEELENVALESTHDVKVTKDMLDLARHIVEQKAGNFEPDKFEDQYETALVDLINQKRAGKPITPKERPRGDNVVDLMDALRKSVGGAAAETRAAPKKGAKKPRKAAAGQKEMLMPIAGKKPAKEAAAKKPAARARRKSA